MLLNISHHPYSSWQPEQMVQAKRYGEVVDIPFPMVSPKAVGEELKKLAGELLNTVLQFQAQSKTPIVVHLMGEMTLTYLLVQGLQALQIPCVASTTERIVSQRGAVRHATFKFIQFRPYPAHSINVI